MQRIFRALFAVALAAAVSQASHAEKKYDPGASDTEIKIGSTNPYSGPASAYGTIGRAEAAYFKMINDQGGVNGRKIRFISLDDGYSPPRNSAIHKYVNVKGIPHIFVNTGATKWGDPKNFPWTMGFNLNYQAEGHIYANYILENKPSAKIAILYQNDDYGKD
ncbi:MAG: ABC transporter substrate-binding protein, partial [Betaproteobacteria bacterium]